MTEQQVKQIILRELPAIMQSDREVREFILRLSREQFADKQETVNRFDRVLDELRRDREEQARKWDENQQNWDAQNRKWWENQQAINEMLASLRQHDQKWDENQQNWDAQNRKWWENQQAINETLKSIEALSHKHDSTIGAIGARWGLYSEQSFRNALKGILEESFNVQVMNITDYDDQGEVFGRPDQVELDVIIKDGMLILCEIKSSMSKSDMYTFERKVRFYEKRHGRQATRMLVISPMVDPRAWSVVEKLGIQVYSGAYDVGPATFAPEPEGDA
ncbi:MAG: DUF3782 domain-containing protein [Chloroflexi bacterium]|nr:DUF3782 domain-containing protein [Chloroflexota bacterium]